MAEPGIGSAPFNSRLRVVAKIIPPMMKTRKQLYTVMACKVSGKSEGMLFSNAMKSGMSSGNHTEEVEVKEGCRCLLINDNSIGSAFIVTSK